MKKLYIKKNRCGVCDQKRLVKLINLKKFPLTGIFVKKNIDKKFPYYFDQKLNICTNCGHLQLEKFISPNLLYNNIYANRTSASHLSDNAISFFKNFLFKTLKRNKLKNILEIGCNDIKLINTLKSSSNHIFGIDPIWIKAKKPKDKKFTIIGDFVENIHLKDKIKKSINIFISTHNLEHISEPYKILKKVVSFAEKDATFFVEVPDADLMIKNYRFDQIFHQHYHYFSYKSLSNLVERLDCKIVNKKINSDFWGGSLLIAFKKRETKKEFKLKNNYFNYKNLISKNYLKFNKHYKKLKKILIKSNTSVGYGAGQMTPSFAYHLNNDLSFLDYIVDDNKQRNNRIYPNLKTKIKYYNEKLITGKNVLITALDGTKIISKKLKNKKVRFINPLLKK